MTEQTSVASLPIGEVGGILTVSSEVFAEGLGIQHKNLLETIRNHKQAIEYEFGLIAFETEAVKNPGARGTKHLSIAHLTEEQALLVGTLSRNSKRVVTFKATLVRSFSEARKRLQQANPTTPSVEQVLLQQAHKLVEQSNLIAQLRDDVNAMMGGKGQRSATLRHTPQLTTIQKKNNNISPSRQRLLSRVNEYCGFHGASQGEAYNYLYKRLHEVFSINVYRLIRGNGESILDTVERYGHLDKLYSLAMAELTYVEE